MTTLTQEAEALAAKHVRGDWTDGDFGSGGFVAHDEGLECVLCGNWCDMPDTLRAIEAAAARRAIEGSGVVEALARWAKEANNALAYTVTNVTPSPHWCRYTDGKHDPMCGGLLTIRTELSAALAALTRDPVQGSGSPGSPLLRTGEGPEEPRVERCVVCVEERGHLLHGSPQDVLPFHPFTPEAR